MSRTATGGSGLNVRMVLVNIVIIVFLQYSHCAASFLLYV